MNRRKVFGQKTVFSISSKQSFTGPDVYPGLLKNTKVLLHTWSVSHFEGLKYAEVQPLFFIQQGKPLIIL
jgi:hypothetical protein